MSFGHSGGGAQSAILGASVSYNLTILTRSLKSQVAMFRCAMATHSDAPYGDYDSESHYQLDYADAAVVNGTWAAR